MNIARPVLHRDREEEIDQLYDGRLIRRVIEQVVPARYLLSDLGEGAFSEVLDDADDDFSSLFLFERAEVFEELLLRNVPLLHRHTGKDTQYVGIGAVLLLADRYHQGRGVLFESEGHYAVLLKEGVMNSGYAVGERRKLFFLCCERIHYFFPCDFRSFS